MLPGPSDYTPIYVHISRYLRGLILDGELRMGDAIPSESKLVKMFGTTRGTVRAAIDVLEADGLIRRAHGKGTFVQLQPIRHNIWNLGGFTDSLRGRSESAVAKVISTRRVELDGRAFHELVRLRGVHGERGTEYLSLDTSWIPLDLFPGIEAEDFENRSLYEYFRTVHHRRPRRTNVNLSAELPSERTRAILGEPADVGALLRAEGSAFDQDENEIERIAIVYSSRIQFNLTTSIPDPDGAGQ